MVFNREILETVFFNQTSFIYLLDTELNITFVSKLLLSAMGKNEGDLIGKNISEIGYNTNTISKLLKLFNLVLEGEVVSGEDIFTSTKGIDTFFEYTFAPVKDHEGTMIAISAVCRDISDRKKMELELINSVYELNKERELRESFIKAMTHDLRTPLTAAKLCAQIIQKHPQDEAGIGKFSTRIIENVDRTDLMIRDVLDSLRLKAGEGITLNIQQHILNAIAESVVEELVTFHGNRIDLVMNEMIKGNWDSSGIRRVMENLLINAIKFGSPDKIITLKIYKDSNFDMISVHNHGEALSGQELEDLFVPFKRLENAKNSGQKGWGIGLTLVLGLTEAHGGVVEVQSRPSAGTTFIIKLPRQTL